MTSLIFQAHGPELIKRWAVTKSTLSISDLWRLRPTHLQWTASRMQMFTNSDLEEASATCGAQKNISDFRRRSARISLYSGQGQVLEIFGLEIVAGVSARTVRLCLTGKRLKLRFPSTGSHPLGPTLEQMVTMKIAMGPGEAS
jgi:hypothetical protein